MTAPEPHIVARTSLSGESGVQVGELDPPLIIWGRPGQDDGLIVDVYSDRTIDPHPDGVVLQNIDDANDPFAPRE